MATFFPRHPIELRLEESKAFRRLSFNLVETGLITGIVLRLYRSVALTHGTASWLYFGGTLALGVAFVCAMATAHLANYPLKKWFWRAPAFAFAVVVGEMTTSVLLIWAHREPTGTARAGFDDWPGMAVTAFWTRELAICAWAALLAVIVTVVRRTIVATELHEKHERERAAGS
ncbi:MAG: hypothetical protein WBQ26_03050 [Gemmatimonadaceae bacterium]|nr:hypothetical protein [Gemmatimonadaceae bacterium]